MAVAFLIVATAPGRARAASSASAAGAITYIGTDNNIYYCATGCARPDCLTCPIAGEHVRRDASGSVRAAAFRAVQEPEEPLEPEQPEQPEPSMASQYGWPTFSPDATRIAYSSITRSQAGVQLWAVGL